MTCSCSDVFLNAAIVRVEVVAAIDTILTCDFILGLAKTVTVVDHCIIGPALGTGVVDHLIDRAYNPFAQVENSEQPNDEQ